MLALLVSVVVGCASQRYQDPEAGYSVAVPDDWTFRPPQKASTVRLGAQSPPLGAGSTHRAHVAIALDRSHARDLETFARESFEVLTTRLRGLRVLESEPAEVGGVPARRVVYTYDDGSGGLTLLTYFLLSGEKGFVLSCGSSADAFDRARPACERVLGSFSLDPS